MLSVRQNSAAICCRPHRSPGCRCVGIPGRSDPHRPLRHAGVHDGVSQRCLRGDSTLGGRGRLRQAGHRAATIGTEEAEMGDEHSGTRLRIRRRAARPAKTVAVPSMISKAASCNLPGGVPPFRLYPSHRFSVSSQCGPEEGTGRERSSILGALVCEARLLGGVFCTPFSPPAAVRRATSRSASQG